MPFPFVICDPVEPPEGCCSRLYEQAVELLTAAANGLNDCHEAGDCCDRTGMRGYVSLGTVQVWQSDILAVYLETPGFSYSPKSFSGSGMMIGPPGIRALWRVYLIESGYPGPTELPNQVMIPNDDQLHAANAHAYAHGEAMLRGVLSSRDITSCTDFALRDYVSVGPTVSPVGWSAGWSLGVTMGVKI